VISHRNLPQRFRSISILEEEDFAEEKGIVAGWGRTQEKGRPSHILREVEVPIMTNEVGIIASLHDESTLSNSNLFIALLFHVIIFLQDCKTSTNYQPKEITDTMMCAGYPGGKLDACQVKVYEIILS